MTFSGIGYDLHRLVEGRKLMIGGVEVPFDKGSQGHSDGDVLSHALCDALLGAASLGDIGTHFPDTDPQWKGASSLLFLEQARKLLADRRLRIVHIDAIVICERPKLGPAFSGHARGAGEVARHHRGPNQLEGQDQRRHGRNRTRRGHRRPRDCHRSATLSRRRRPR